MKTRHADRRESAAAFRRLWSRPVRRLLCGALAGVALAGFSPAMADTVIPLNPHSGFATYYLTVQVGAGLVDEYLVDTGAGYMTITDATLTQLQQAGQARFLRKIEGRLADGRMLTVPVYVLDEIVIGSTCVLRDVEAVVLPGASRGLFGLSALRRTSPFEFSIDPPTLRLSNCFQRTDLASAEPSR